MNIRNYIAILILLLAASCRQPKALVYQRTQNFSVQTSGVKQTYLAADVCLYNPNKFPLKIKDVDLDVSLNDNHVGKIKVKERIFIPALDTVSIPVSLNVDLKTVFPNALQILFNHDITLKFTGTLKAHHWVYITIPVDFESKQDLRAW